MLVLKFGGTSVGVPEHFRIATGLVATARSRDPVVVVSALSGVTNLLVDYCRGADSRADLAAQFFARHRDFAHDVDLDPALLEPLFERWREASASAGAGGEAIVGAGRD